MIFGIFSSRCLRAEVPDLLKSPRPTLAMGQFSEFWFSRLCLILFL
jgi:hypothetical protein